MLSQDQINSTIQKEIMKKYRLQNINEAYQSNETAANFESHESQEKTKKECDIIKSSETKPSSREAELMKSYFSNLNPKIGKCNKNISKEDIKNDNKKMDFMELRIKEMKECNSDDFSIDLNITHSRSIKGGVEYTRVIEAISFSFIEQFFNSPNSDIVNDISKIFHPKVVEQSIDSHNFFARIPNEKFEDLFKEYECAKDYIGNGLLRMLLSSKDVLDNWRHDITDISNTELKAISELLNVKIETMRKGTSITKIKYNKSKGNPIFNSPLRLYLGKKRTKILYNSEQYKTATSNIIVTRTKSSVKKSEASNIKLNQYIELVQPIIEKLAKFTDLKIDGLKIMRQLLDREELDEWDDIYSFITQEASMLINNLESVKNQSLINLHKCDICNSNLTTKTMYKLDCGHLLDSVCLKKYFIILI